MSITLEQAKALGSRDEIHSNTNENKDGTCQRWRVNGRVRRWKRNPDRIEIPIKHGLYSFDYLRNGDLELVHLATECPKRSKC